MHPRLRMSWHFHFRSAPSLWAALCLAMLMLCGPAGTAAAQSLSASSQAPQASLKRWFGLGKSSAELLPAEEAYQLTTRSEDADTIVATLVPAKDYYIYRERVQFQVLEPAGASIAKVAFPRGVMKLDPNFGNTEVYQQLFDARVHLAWAGDRTASVRLQVSYQGCNEPLGVCYPPVEKVVDVQMAGAAAGVSAVGGATGPLAVAPPVVLPTASGDASEAGRLRSMFSSGGVAGLLMTFFGLGILLALTPCMLPMVPILSGIIAGSGSATSRKRALGLSSLYILGMAIAYAMAGVAAGLAGSMVAATLQNPWVLGAFALTFVLLSLSMFGLFELQVPASVQARLAAISNRLPGGKAVGVFLMGVISAVIVGPCVAAPLAAALVYISQTGDAVLGGVALFLMAIGMGVPLLAIGASTNALLRWAGPWTAVIKAAFGVALLAMAIYVISPVVPLSLQHVLWAALLIVTAMFMHAIDPLPAGAAPGHRLIKGLGIFALVAGVSLLIGALSGSRDLLQPLAAARPAAPAGAGELRFAAVRDVAELESHLAAARGRHVMLDFTAEWCVACKEMERFTFSDAAVQARLRDVVLLRADVTANSAQDKALLKRFSLFGPPGIVFFDASGRELPHRVIGYQASVDFLKSLGQVFPPARICTAAKGAMADTASAEVESRAKGPEGEVRRIEMIAFRTSSQNIEGVSK